MTDFPVESHVVAPAAISIWRRMYWSVQRELWENRSIYLAPIFVAAVFVFGFFIGVFSRPFPRHGIKTSYDFAAIVIMATAFIVSVFYCLEALNSERRDRSILFWKSLPVSDLTTVLAKASIPVVVLPLITFAVTIATQVFLLVTNTAAAMGSGRTFATVWSDSHLLETAPGLLYHLLVIHGFWYAPIFGWLLFVSAWARRAPFLWAALPLFAIGAAERLIFNTSYFAGMLMNRIGGGAQGAVAHAGSTSSMDLMPAAGPLQFVISPGFWIGLAVTAIFLGAAVRLRRKREPI